MRLEPLYRVRFTYPEGWEVKLTGDWEQHFYLAEGRCEGWISGRFRGANFPRRQGPGRPFMPDFRGVIETDDGATIMWECHGYGRAYPAGRRQIVAAILHSCDREPYGRMNDAVCHRSGRRTPFRSSRKSSQPPPALTIQSGPLKHGAPHPATSSASSWKSVADPPGGIRGRRSFSCWSAGPSRAV